MGENSPTFATLPNTSVPQPDGPARGLTHAIISIGSNSDAVIDRFGLGDGVILQLHTLMTTVRSSKWEEKLRTAEWGLSFEQAVSLSNGLLLDLEVIKLKAQVCKLLCDFRNAQANCISPACSQQKFLPGSSFRCSIFIGDRRVLHRPPGVLTAAESIYANTFKIFFNSFGGDRFGISV
jgi:hypothetical protein